MFNPVGEGMNRSAEAMGLTYVVRPAHGGGWEWWLCLKTDCKRCDGMTAAIEACQADFNIRWLAETEVMPLEWIDTADDCSIGSSQTGTYYVELGVNSKDYWIWDAPGAKAERCDSRDHGKQLCEAQHRKIVLGE